MFLGFIIYLLFNHLLSNHFRVKQTKKLQTPSSQMMCCFFFSPPCLQHQNSQGCLWMLMPSSEGFNTSYIKILVFWCWKFGNTLWGFLWPRNVVATVFSSKRYMFRSCCFDSMKISYFCKRNHKYIKLLIPKGYKNTAPMQHLVFTAEFV